MPRSLLVPGHCEIFGRATLIIFEHIEPDFWGSWYAYSMTNALNPTIWFSILLLRAWKNLCIRKPGPGLKQ